MRFGLKEIDWEYAGALLAQTDDNSQAKFIKSFLKECESWGTHLQIESQLAHVNHLLTTEEKEMLKMLSYMEGDE